MQDSTARHNQTDNRNRRLHLVYSRGQRLEPTLEARPSTIPRPMLAGGALVALAGTLWWVGHATLLALRMR